MIDIWRKRQFPKRSLFTRFDELLQKCGPFFLEEIGTRERAVPADHHQISDSQINQILSGFLTTGTLPEFLTSGRADYSATLKK